MKIDNLKIKKRKYIYSIDIENIYNSNKEYFTTKKEAIKQAKKEKEFTKELIIVNKLIWDAEEEKYCYQYENGALIPSILEI